MTLLRVPIHPSEQVIFPGQLFPLPPGDDQLSRILRFCQDEACPLGVVFVPDERGHALARVGTLAHWVQAGGISRPSVREVPVEPLVVGSSRFEILQIHQDHPFMEATVRLWPWREQPEPSWALVERVGDYLRRYAQAFSDLMPSALLPDLLKPDAATLGVLSAAVLHLSSVEKQYLLELPSADALLRAVVRHLRLHVPIAERLAMMPPHELAAHERILMN